MSAPRGRPSTRPKCKDNEIYDTKLKICRKKKSPGRKPLLKKSPVKKSPLKSPLKNSPKSPQSPKSTSSRLPKKSKILKSLPKLKSKEQIEKLENYQNYDALKHARGLYGKRVHYLNPTTIKKFNLTPGQTFWGLEGQYWGFGDIEDEQNWRNSEITKITFGGFVGEDNEHEFLGTEGDKKHLFRASHHEYDDIVVNGYLAHTLDEKVYGTGSGSDPVFIFV